jgi:hypothetical protein
MVASSNIVTDKPLENLPKQIKYDPELLTFADLKRTNGANAVQTLKLLETCITAWPFDLKFEKGAAKRLQLEDSGLLINTILQGIGEDITEAVKGVVVDFKSKGWTLETLEKLGELDVSGDYQGMTDMFREVCTWAGGSPSDPMNCIQGGAAYKAIMDKWNRIVSGKN